MKIILLRNSHTVILKRWRRVNIKNSKFHNNTNNSYEIWSKSLGLDQGIIEILDYFHPSIRIHTKSHHLHTWYIGSHYIYF